MSFIRLSNVTKTFHAGDEAYSALKSVSLNIASGEFIAVIGPSGSGKSTLLSLVGGLSRATSGNVSVDNIDLGGLGPDRLSDFRREYLGFVFQSFYLVPYLTALENVMLPLTVQPRLRRVAIARAIVNRPPLILADEPTGNLDTKTRSKVLDILASLHADGHTIVMVTHSEENAKKAGRVIEIRDGEVV